MAIRDVPTGVMIDIFKDWLTRQDVLQEYALTAGYTQAITDTAQQLTDSTKSSGQPLSEKERQAVSKAAKEIDREFDHPARVLHGAFALLALAFQGRTAEYEHASVTLLPDGLGIINTSYRNESGETERIASRVERDPAIKKLLQESTLCGEPLVNWFDQLVDAGRRLGPLARKLELTPEQATMAGLEFNARQKWTFLVTTLRRTCQLAGWSDEHMAAFFDQVDRQSAAYASTPVVEAEVIDEPTPTPVTDLPNL